MTIATITAEIRKIEEKQKLIRKRIYKAESKENDAWKEWNRLSTIYKKTYDKLREEHWKLGVKRNALKEKKYR